MSHSINSINVQPVVFNLYFVIIYCVYCEDVPAVDMNNVMYMELYFRQD